MFSYHLFNKVPITRTIQTEMSTKKKVMKRLIIKANKYAIIINCKPTLFKCENFSQVLRDPCRREYYSPRSSLQMSFVNYFPDNLPIYSKISLRELVHFQVNCAISLITVLNLIKWKYKMGNLHDCCGLLFSIWYLSLLS